MSNQNELVSIIKKFAESGWDLIENPAKVWLASQSDKNTLILITAVKQADKDCGSCGCEMDQLYKKALALLSA